MFVRRNLAVIELVILKVKLPRLISSLITILV